MGHYTELRVDFHLKADTPADVIQALRYMVGQLWNPTTREDDPLPVIPEHPLFRCERWDDMLRSLNCRDDCYQEFWQEPDGHWHLRVLSEFKNYNDEIDHFFDWLKEHIIPGENGIAGYWIGEDRRLEDEPWTVYVIDGVVSELPGRPTPQDDPWANLGK